MAGTEIVWEQPAKILPIDPAVREAVLRIESAFEDMLSSLQSEVGAPALARALASVGSLLHPRDGRARHHGGDESEVRAELLARLPRTHGEAVLPAAAVA